MKVKLSIVTICFNDLAGLKRTFNSVFNQNWQNFEYIVIDGASTDGTKELIQSHAERLAYWVSEPDKGIFNAQNKGWQKANGEYLLFLNSGDELFDKDTLQTAIEYLDGPDIVYGNLLNIEPDKQWLKEYNKQLSAYYFYWDTLPHQASFIKAAFLSRMGGYDESLKLVSDWKFFMLATCKFDAAYKYINQTIARYDLQGISSSADSWNKLRLEREFVWKQEMPLVYNSILHLLDEQAKSKNLRRLLNYMPCYLVYKLILKLKTSLRIG